MSSTKLILFHIAGKIFLRYEFLRTLLNKQIKITLITIDFCPEIKPINYILWSHLTRTRMDRSAIRYNVLR